MLLTEHGSSNSTLLGCTERKKKTGRLEGSHVKREVNSHGSCVSYYFMINRPHHMETIFFSCFSI